MDALILLNNLRAAKRRHARLQGVKVGDKVQFDADRVNGQLTVTKLQKGRQIGGARTSCATTVPRVGSHVLNPMLERGRGPWD
jgi:hypothetical protein